MTFQHRSRIKSAIDYTFIISDLGGCCMSDDETPTESTYQDCIEGGGLFIQTEYDSNGDPILVNLECPSLSTRGCCCACGYVENFDDFYRYPGSNTDGSANTTTCEDPNNQLTCYQGGVKNNVTRCECDRLNGRWSHHPCDYFGGERNSIQSLCTREFRNKDVRWPGACCVSDICHSKCTLEECADVEPPPHENTQWRPNEICVNDVSIYGPNVTDCSDGAYTPMGVRDIASGLLIVRQRSEEIDRTNTQKETKSKTSTSTVTSSCVYKDNDNSVCSLLDEGACNNKRGIWLGVNSDNEFYTSESTKCKEALDLFENAGSISASYVNGWELGDLVFGGRYLGKFNVKSNTFGSGSICYGNPETGPAKDYVAEATSNTENSKNEYAVIIANHDSYSNRVGMAKNSRTKKLSSSVIRNNSSWDMAENNKSWVNDIQFGLRKKYAQYLKWGVPSQDILSFAYRQTQELEFITNSIIKNTHYPYNKMKKGYYWTNSLYNKRVKNKIYAHVQNFDDDSFVAVQPISDFAFSRIFLVIPIK